MSPGLKTQWILKSREGIVSGPFSTEQIISKINRGEITGEEYISTYPNSDWHPISRDPQFYDKLLEFLEGEKDASHDASERISADDSAPSKLEVTPTPTRHKKNRAERVSTSAPTPPPPTEPIANDEAPVIELKKLKKVRKEIKVKKSIVPIIIAVVALSGLAFYLMTDTENFDDRIRLLAPHKGGPQRSTEEMNVKNREGIAYLQRDDLPGYLAAQNSFVQAFEGDNRNAAALGYLCVTYLELWPNSFQDSQDLQTVLLANQYASQIDPASVEAATCKVVDLLVRGRFVEARSVTETVLETYSQDKFAMVMFYYFKAKLLESNKEIESAQNYVRSAQHSMPKWLRLYSYEGALLSKLKRFEEAAKRFRQILQVNPGHATSLIELGLLEYKFFKNVPQGEEYIRRGLASVDRAPREVGSRGHLGLAEIALQRDDTGTALSEAQKAYALNSTNERAKEIIVRIGGDKKLRETKVLDLQLVYEGDQLVREGDCSSAQAHYKAAYEVNPKNGIAAMKAAECSWSISLTSDAIDWLNRAIRADPQLIDAYVMQADFFSQRYNFTAAAQVLARANQVRPNHYKVYRGLAMVELRRLNAKGAVQSAERAIQLYESDVDSYVILAEAYVQMREHSKAFSAASKATEIDINNRKAQIIYADALVGIQGMPAALEYLNRLVNVYPMITEYRIALGDLYMKDQGYAAAEVAYEQTTRIDDKPREAFMKLGQARQAQRKYDMALDAYLKSAELDPSNPEPLLLAGLLYLEIKKPIDAQMQFKRVMRVNKDYPRVNYYIGRAALMNGAADEALKAATEEKQRNPNLADAYLLAADAYVQLEQYNLCASEYQQALKLRPQGTMIYVKMARCFRLAGNLDAAVSMIGNAGSKESGEPEVWKEQGAIFEARSEAVKAIEAYQQYLVLAPNAVDRVQIEGRIQALSR